MYLKVFSFLLGKVGIALLTSETSASDAEQRPDDGDTGRRPERRRSSRAEDCASGGDDERCSQTASQTCASQVNDERCSETASQTCVSAITLRAFRSSDN